MLKNDQTSRSMPSSLNASWTETQMVGASSSCSIGGRLAMARSGQSVVADRDGSTIDHARAVRCRVIDARWWGAMVRVFFWDSHPLTEKKG